MNSNQTCPYEAFDAQFENAKYLIGSRVFATTPKGEKIRGEVKFVRRGITTSEDPRVARVLVDVHTGSGWIIPCELETVIPE